MSRLDDWTQMRFGLLSNNRRPAMSLSEAWKLDGDEIVHADKYGMDEAWVSSRVATADLLIARLIGLTSRIRLGPGVRLLPLYHPIQVAQDAAACDQLSGGRYMLGVGHGAAGTKQTLRGLDTKDVLQRTNSALDILLRLFSESEPFDIDGPYWYGKDLAIGIDWVNGPPEVCQAVSANPESGRVAGQKGVGLLTTCYAQPDTLHALTSAFVEGQEQAGRPATRAGIRTGRIIYVADTDEQARAEIRGSYESVIKVDVNHWHSLKKESAPSGEAEDLSFEGLIDSRHLMVGSPETVRDMIEEFYNQVGGFGVLLLHGGRDYAAPEQLANSIGLFMDQVAPKLSHLHVD